MHRPLRLGLATAIALLATLPGAALAQGDRYSLAGGCYALRSAAAERFVVKAADGS